MKKNINLLDKLDMIERIEYALEIGLDEAKKPVALERKQAERKLYQKLPLMNDETGSQ